jgi:hypothetical protein
MQATTSNDPSGKSGRCASPVRNSAPGTAAVAAATARRSSSIPVTRRPRSSANAANAPGPHPMSSTDAPAGTPSSARA